MSAILRHDPMSLRYLEQKTEVLLAGRKSLVVGQAVTWRQGSRLVRSTSVLFYTAILGFHMCLDQSIVSGI